MTWLGLVAADFFTAALLAALLIGVCFGIHFDQGGYFFLIETVINDIRLVEGNLEDPAGIFKNARSVTRNPIWGMFSVQVSHALYPHFDESATDKIIRRWHSATAPLKNAKAKP